MNSDITYLNDRDEIVSQDQATKAIIREYDEKGNLINETFGYMTPNKPFYEGNMTAEDFEERMRQIDEIFEFKSIRR